MRELKFGWSWQGHRAIERAAFESLPKEARPLKQFFKQHLDEINQHSINEDKKPDNTSHLFFWEQLNQKNVKKLPANQRDFDIIKDKFSFENKKHFIKQNRTSPVSQETLNSKSNPFSLSVGLYHQLVSQLKQLEQANTAPEQETIKQSILKTTGKLSHYVADLTQPMHSTQYYFWNLPSKEQPNSHRFFEMHLLTEGETIQWMIKQSKEIYTEGKRVFNKADFKQLKSRLCEEANKSYERFYDIVMNDAAIRGSVHDDRYSDLLRIRWKDIAKDRMSVAANLLNQIVTAAYQEADSPKF